MKTAAAASMKSRAAYEQIQNKSLRTNYRAADGKIENTCCPLVLKKSRDPAQPRNQEKLKVQVMVCTKQHKFD
jgi:hypothetical protein